MVSSSSSSPAMSSSSRESLSRGCKTKQTIEPPKQQEDPDEAAAASPEKTSTNSPAVGSKRKTSSSKSGKMKPKLSNVNTSGYHLFCLEKRPAIKEQYPDVEHGNEHTKKLAAMWKAMGKEEKDVYNKQAAKIRKAATKSQLEADKTGPSTSESVNEESARRSSYQLFCEEKRPDIRKEYPDANGLFHTKKLAEIWRAMTKEEKKVYNDKAAKIRKTASKGAKKAARGKKAALTGPSTPAAAPMEEEGDTEPEGMEDKDGEKEDEEEEEEVVEDEADGSGDEEASGVIDDSDEEEGEEKEEEEEEDEMQGEEEEEIHMSDEE